jgi:energy-coupling factor transporter transmembrane protein EcfT
MGASSNGKSGSSILPIFTKGVYYLKIRVNLPFLNRKPAMKGFISKDLHPFTALLILLLFIAGGFFVGNFVAMLLMNLFFNVSLTDITRLTQDPNALPNGKVAINLFQGVTHLFAFTVAPLAGIFSIYWS